MNTKLTLALLFLLLAFRVGADPEEKQLTGTVIFSSEPDNNHPSSHAFDDNINTYFKVNKGGYLGFDLGKQNVITKIAYAPSIEKEDYAERMQLGIFEGANKPDFSDAIPLFIIKDTPEEKVTEQEINCSRGFRYVRFVFPLRPGVHSSESVGTWTTTYISELKFFGHEGEGDNSHLSQLTNIPVISIKTVGNQEITDKNNYIKGVITVIWADGTRIHTDSLEIKGRGNNSWGYPKKPYRIKMYNKARLLDLPANAKSWTLINSYGDKTLLRNTFAFDFSKRMEMEYTSPAEPVDVIVNGDYRGCYQLSDQIEVRKGRVDVPEITKDNITGSYMVEIDSYAHGDAAWFDSAWDFNVRSMPVSIKYPDDDEITGDQWTYIEDHFNKWVSSVSADNYKNLTKGFRKYTDTESFLRRFLITEYTGTTDALWSVRMVKRPDDDKFYFYPVWDFDISFENDWRTYPINSNPNWICLSSGSAVGGARDAVSRILSDDAMVDRMEEIYAYYRDHHIITKDKLLEVVDHYADYIYQSQDLNFKRWRIMNEKVHENFELHGSFEAEVDWLKDYIWARIDWLDDKLNYVPNPVEPDKIDNVEKSPLVTVVSDYNTISVTKKTDEAMSVRIVDVMGRDVYKKALVMENTSIQMEKGLYIVIVTNNKQQTQTVKCVVR